MWIHHSYLELCYIARFVFYVSIFTLETYIAGSYLLEIIGLDERGYQANNFLISQRKHMLWVLIGSASVFLLRNKENIDTFWLKKMEMPR